MIRFIQRTKHGDHELHVDRMGDDMLIVSMMRPVDGVTQLQTFPLPIEDAKRLCEYLAKESGWNQ